MCVGVREGGASWKKALEDGFIPGETLFSIENAVDNGTIIMYLLSDAGQIDVWPQIRDRLNNKALYFSHGFGVVYQDQTKIDVDNLKTTDVIMVAPKGSGKSVRRVYQEG